MEEGYEHASDAVEQIVQGEIEAAMNVFNKKVKHRRRRTCSFLQDR